MKKQFLLRGLYAPLLFGLAACGASPQDQDDSDEPVPAAVEQLLAEVDIPGGKARFTAIDSDVLFIETQLATGSRHALFDPAVRGLNAVQLYERWSGKPAPEALVEVAREVAQAEEADQASDESVGTRASALTAPEFNAQKCPGMQYCWLDRTGTWEHSERARRWLGWVNSVRGAMTISMRRFGINGWESQWVRDVPDGDLREHRAISGAINKRDLKFKIYNADGDHWHLSADWD